MRGKQRLRLIACRGEGQRMYRNVCSSSGLEDQTWRLHGGMTNTPPRTLLIESSLSLFILNPVLPEK